LPAITDPNVLVGLEAPDDAGVYLLNPEQALVATVDYFTPIVDDPYAFGQIAAANALSDVYAMGGRPLYALSLVGFPRDKLPLATLGEILKGGCDKALEAGICVIGGHSIDDPEPKYGLAVTGLVDPKRIVAKGGARPGDRLFLTKPLGIGIISTGIKAGVVEPDAIERAIALMATLNRAACEAMMAVGPTAGTDVTGFGLLGHLDEMLRAGGVGARVRLDRVPIIAEARKLIEDGVCPGGTRRNRTHLLENGRVDFGDLTEEEQLLLCDAQTSGGLLIAVAPEKAQALHEALVAAGTPVAAEIGEITDQGIIRVTRG
jgi:selenide,water dikinase